MNKDNNNKQTMTEQELDMLASKIVAKLVDIQNAISWHETTTWNSSIARNIQDKFDNDFTGLSEEETLVAEMAKLMTMMNMYEEKEEYEKCAKIKKKIDTINRRLKNIGK